MKKQCYKSLKIFLTFLLLINIISCNSDSTKKVDSAPIPDEYSSYQFLSSNKAQSQRYRIVQVIDYSEKFGESKSEVRRAFYATNSELFFVELYSWNGGGIFIKMNTKGVILDTLPYTVKNEIDSSELFPKTHFNGVIFYDDFYIDWFHTGDKTPKKYQYVANMDAMSEKDFAIKYNESNIVYYEDTVFSEERVDAYLLNENGWSRLSSNKLYQGFRYKTSEPNTVKQSSVSNLFFFVSERCQKLTSRSFPQKYVTDFIQLLSERNDYSCIPNEQVSVSYSMQYLHKVGYSPPNGFGATAPRGETWDGIAYYDLSIDDDNIPFKSYSISFRPALKVFSSTSHQGQSYVILDSPRFGGSTSFHLVEENPQNESGLYLVVPN